MLHGQGLSAQSSNVAAAMLASAVSQQIWSQHSVSQRAGLSTYGPGIDGDLHAEVMTKVCHIGEMVRAMSAQKRDLGRRLKAAESSNRQLRSELQHYKAGVRGLPQTAQTSELHQGYAGGVRGILVVPTCNCWCFCGNPPPIKPKCTSFRPAVHCCMLLYEYGMQ